MAFLLDFLSRRQRLLGPAELKFLYHIGSAGGECQRPTRAANPKFVSICGTRAAA
jgi:hypothetical protein